MKKYISIKCTEAPEHGSDAFTVNVMAMCDPISASEFMASAMFKLNKDINDVLPKDKKNFFWNRVVEIVGERMLEESKR